MANYKVQQYSSSIKKNENGYPNLFIECKLLNKSGNPTFRSYRIWSDERHPDINSLSQLLELGFNNAKSSGKSVVLSDYAERMYLFLTLPDVNGGQEIQVSAERT